MQSQSLPYSQRRHSRRGSTLALAVVLMFVLFSFLAFSIDTGYLSQSRAEIHRSADAAAMAGCWELYEQLAQGNSEANSHAQVRSASAALALLNPVCNQGPHVETTAESQDIEIGYLSNLRNATLSDNPSAPYYAVRVRVKRHEDQNGTVPFFFGRIYGRNGIPMEQEATAVMGRQIDGFNAPPVGGAGIELLPFALDSVTWDALASAGDNYAYDPITGEVTSGTGDGAHEVNLYPQGTGSPGNRGTVDIGGANNSTNDIARQIIHGISAEDISDLGKELRLDATGKMTLNGDTGISAGVKDELASIIGQKRIIPVFSSVAGNGNNASYEIVKWVGVRILHVKLTGKMSGKQLIVQPAHVLTPYATVPTDGSTWSEYVVSPVMLAQ